MLKRWRGLFEYLCSGDLIDIVANHSGEAGLLLESVDIRSLVLGGHLREYRGEPEFVGNDGSDLLGVSRFYHRLQYQSSQDCEATFI